MRRVALPLIMALMTASCAAPVVYAPGDLEGAAATGRIAPLAKILADAGGKSLRIVFVHGVGDHCAGYALDRKVGWLNDDAAARMGLVAKDDAPVAYRKVGARVFVPGSDNDASYLEVGRRAFSMRLRDAAAIDVDAIEITWSHTTQWLKSNALGYDSPSVTPTDKDDEKNCIVAQSATVPIVKRPPDRLWLDRIIKEQVFDRNLADAILYSGSYGSVIERAFADALCRALVDTADNVACSWSGIDLAADATRRYFFVTHSLGSRIVYDAMLDLIGAGSPGRPNVFEDKEWIASRPVVRQMIANTPAFFMMANQLSLLGLANASPLADPKDGPTPMVVADARVAARLGAANAESLAAVSDIAATRDCDNPIASIAQVRTRALQALRRPSGDELTLKIVAFNDTNDLLTWHVPQWYATGKAGCRPDVELTNVFVRNALPVLIAESPTAAHRNYFRNPSVWQAIVCGADKGRLRDCSP